MKKYFDKKRIIFVIVIMFLVIVAGVYGTYATGESSGNESDMQLSFELSNFLGREIVVEAGRNKSIEIKVNNNNVDSVRYAVTYKMLNPTTLPDDFIVTQAVNSERSTTGIIGSNKNAIITIYMENNTDSTVSLKFNVVNGYRFGGDFIIPEGEVIVPRSNYNNVPIYDMIEEMAVLDNAPSDFVTGATGINFLEISSDTNGKGIYTMSETADDKFPVHYYRGNVSNNNVFFAGFCWKILRTTETGGTKLLYNGVPKADGSCDNTGSSVFISGSSKYNNSSGRIEYAGYSYQTAVLTQSGKYAWDFAEGIVFGKSVNYDPDSNTYTLIDTATPSYDDSSATGFKDFADELSIYHYSCMSTSTTCTDVKFMYMGRESNTTIYYISLNKTESIADLLKKTYITGATNQIKSSMHTKVENWYRDNMTSKTSFFEDAVWCNDRSIGSIGGWSDTGLIYEDNVQNVSMKLQFGSFTRVLTGKPSTVCPNKVDSFTTKTSNGNGNLVYPVGLITGDEAVLAGHVWWVSNTSTYIHNKGTNRDTFWWTMSPSYLAAGGVYAILGYDMLDGLAINYGSLSIGLRPMVSLRYGIVRTGGTGTVTDPFTIDNIE